MDDVTHTLLVIGVIFISYKLGSFVGKADAYSDGFADGSNAGIDSIMDFLRTKYNMVFDYTVKIEEE